MVQIKSLPFFLDFNNFIFEARNYIVILQASDDLKKVLHPEIKCIHVILL